MNYLQKLLFFPLIVLLMIPESSAETIKVAAIDWCPQICVNETRKGYTVELITKIFENSNFEVEIDVFPWSRAIKYVSLGKYDALLAPAKKEAPHLIYPHFNVGIQKMCFFTAHDNPWIYNGEDSLTGMSVGIASDTSIEELSDYISLHPAQFQYQPYHERYVFQSANKVLKGRIDAFLFTLNTTMLELNKVKLNSVIKNAGCVSEAKIYLAFTPLSSAEARITKATLYFDQRMEELIKTGYLDQLFKKYNIL